MACPAGFGTDYIDKGQCDGPENPVASPTPQALTRAAAGPPVAADFLPETSALYGRCTE